MRNQMPTINQEVNTDESDSVYEEYFSEADSDLESEENENYPISLKNILYSKVIINISSTQYEVIRLVMEDIFKYTVTNTNRSEWDLYWADDISNFFPLKPFQKINHFPEMMNITKKNLLAKNLNRIKKKYPEDYNFFPKTWLLPFDYYDLKLYDEENIGRTYIIKPEALCQGIGIFLAKNIKKINSKEHRVVQEYISNPYLIEGLKFDLRIYVLVYGCNPLRIFLYNEGLVRLATEQYKKPTNKNIDDLFINLTNYAINKNNKKFIFNRDAQKANVGHKRSLTFLWNEIDSKGGNSKKVIYEIKLAIVKTLFSIQKILTHGYRAIFPLDHSNRQCFEILGFDFLLDNNLKPWLLEVNHSPSFSIDTPFDELIKTNLIKDTVKLLNLKSKKRINFYKRKRKNKFSKLNLNNNERNYENEILWKRKMEKQNQYEESNLGNFTLIFPDKNENYEKIFEVQNIGFGNIHKNNSLTNQFSKLNKINLNLLSHNKPAFITNCLRRRINFDQEVPKRNILPNNKKVSLFQVSTKKNTERNMNKEDLNMIPSFLACNFRTIKTSSTLNKIGIKFKSIETSRIAKRKSYFLEKIRKINQPKSAISYYLFKDINLNENEEQKICNKNNNFLQMQLDCENVPKDLIFSRKSSVPKIINTKKVKSYNLVTQ